MSEFDPSPLGTLMGIAASWRSPYRRLPPQPFKLNAIALLQAMFDADDNGHSTFDEQPALTLRMFAAILPSLAPPDHNPWEERVVAVLGAWLNRKLTLESAHAALDQLDGEIGVQTGAINESTIADAGQNSELATLSIAREAVGLARRTLAIYRDLCAESIEKSGPAVSQPSGHTWTPRVVQIEDGEEQSPRR